MMPSAAPAAAALAGFDPIALIVLVFLLLPVIQSVLGKKQGEEQGRRPGQRRPQGGLPPSSRDASTTPRRAETGADLVPDDLWELLTGERRQRTHDTVPTGEWAGSSQDVPISGSSEPEPDWDAIPEPAPYEPVTEAEEESGHPWRVSDEPTPMVLRRERSDNLPEAVSLEQPIPSDAVREREFHEELAHLPPPARAHRRRRLSYGLGHADEVRRAFILTEILGPPKGLQ